MIKNFLDKYKNIHIIIISVAVVVWFYAWTGIIELITQKSKKLEIYLCLMFFSLLVIYLDDYKLTELARTDSKDSAIVTAAKSHIG